MKFSKLDLLTLLISLFLFSACNKSNTLGLNLDPNNAIQGSLVDTLTVNAKTVTDDPVLGSSLVRYPLGFLTDDLIGTSQASLAMSVNLPSAAYSFGTNATVDSVVLTLPYAAQPSGYNNLLAFYGDTISTNYTVNVYQLNKNILAEPSFLSNKVWDYNTTSQGTFSGKIKPTTAFMVTDIVPGKAGTLKSVKQLRIKLNNAFISGPSGVLKYSPAQLLNNASFNNAFKGLYVTASASGGKGGIMFFDMASTAANLEIYYKRQNATTATAIDTVLAAFPVQKVNGPISATIQHTWSASVNTQLNDATNKQYPTNYLQGLAGLKTKISFPYLQKFKSDLGGSRIIINKAELVVELSSGTDVAPLTPADRITLYRYDIAGQRTVLPDASVSTVTSATDPRAVQDISQFGGFYDTTNKRYVFQVTSYIQDLYDGKTTDYGTFLCPISPTEFSFGPSLATATRSVIGAFKNTNNRIKLNVYYTKITDK